MIDFIYVVVIFGAILLTIGFIIREYILVLFSGLIMMVCGIYIGVYGVGDLTSFFTQSFAAILIGLGAYIMINSSIEKMS